jgi:ArsR family transcriptional regulator, arsenate/arsenite/antimonite-responsive transcriptional repressor
MKENHADAVTRLAALAQQTRLALFRRLVEAGHTGLSAGVIAERVGVAAPTLSFHLKELTRAGLIRAAQQGRHVIYTADFDAMNALIAYLTENCCRMDGEAACGPACASKVDRPRSSRKGATSIHNRRS